MDRRTFFRRAAGLGAGLAGAAIVGVESVGPEPGAPEMAHSHTSGYLYVMRGASAPTASAVTLTYTDNTGEPWHSVNWETAATGHSHWGSTLGPKDAFA